MAAAIAYVEICRPSPDRLSGLYNWAVPQVTRRGGEKCRPGHIPPHELPGPIARRRAAEQRDELAPFYLTELHLTLDEPGLRRKYIQLMRFSQEAAERFHNPPAEFVQSAAADDAVIKIAVRRIGLALVFARLWEETGCRAVIADLAAKRGHKFALERAVFLTVLHWLLVSGSDRAADRWREDYAIAGGDGLDLHHLYRAMAWLGEELPEPEQDGRTPFAPRCLKDVVEERLFAHRREHAHAARPGVHGHHQPVLRGCRRPDARPARLQQGSSAGSAADVLAVLIDGDGRPVCSETWPGNTADVTTREGQLSTIPCVNRSVATIASYTSSVIITPSS
jgi:hypothetical protein